MSSRTGRRCVGREWTVAESNGTRRERISIVGAVDGAETHQVSFRKYFKAAHGKKKLALKKKTIHSNEPIVKQNHTDRVLHSVYEETKRKKSSAAWRLIKSFTFLSSQVK